MLLYNQCLCASTCQSLTSSRKDILLILTASDLSFWKRYWCVILLRAKFAEKRFDFMNPANSPPNSSVYFDVPQHIPKVFLHLPHFYFLWHLALHSLNKTEPKIAIPILIWPQQVNFNKHGEHWNKRNRSIILQYNDVPIVSPKVFETITQHLSK